MKYWYVRVDLDDGTVVVRHEHRTVPGETNLDALFLVTNALRKEQGLTPREDGLGFLSARVTLELED